jgi:two-component system sensor histidine kinase AtoS
LLEADSGVLGVLNRLRQDRSSTELPLIVITPASSEATEVLIDAGADEIMRRPLEMPLLMQRLQGMIDLASAQRRVHELEAQLEWAAKMEALGYLNSGLAHDVKGQLAQMQMGFDALRARDREQIEDTGAIVYPIIKSAIEKADGMLEGFIRFTSAPELSDGPIDLHELLESEIGRVGALALEAGVSIETEFDESIPGALADILTMRQIVGALISNAIESMPAGGEIRIRTSLAPQEGPGPGGDQMLSVTIEDFGGGIAEAILPKIYSAFFTTKAPDRGIGLGLTIAKNLILLNGGRLLIENRPQGGGTIATLQLRATKPR